MLNNADYDEDDDDDAADAADDADADADGGANMAAGIHHFKKSPSLTWLWRQCSLVPVDHQVKLQEHLPNNHEPINNPLKSVSLWFLW